KLVTGVQTCALPIFLSDDDVREDVLGRLHELVVKPTGESGGKGVFIGPHTPPEELEGLADVIRRDPGLWIAQDVVDLSTVPTAEIGRASGRERGETA